MSRKEGNFDGFIEDRRKRFIRRSYVDELYSENV